VSSVDLHPEDLLDRARRGEASPDELERLRAHLAGCAACRFEGVLAEDCARAAAPRSAAEDALVLSRVQRGAARAVRARGAMRSSWAPRRASRLVYAAAAVLVFAATVATATTLVRRVWRAPEIAPIASAPARHHVSSRAPSKPVVEEAAAESDEVLGEDAVDAPAPRAAHARHVATAESPGELFARANAARRRGATREAVRLYRELEREFPGSQEELVSRVTMGRWRLDSLDDPSGALRSFDSYLANPVHTALREEALIGRALSLGRLGRETEERGAWRAFLAAFPGSVYAERARGRLAVLH
jgi:hypothetical protein